MTTQEHLQVTIGNLIIQLCTVQAEVDRLNAEVKRLTPEPDIRDILKTDGA